MWWWKGDIRLHSETIETEVRLSLTRQRECVVMEEVFGFQEVTAREQKVSRRGVDVTHSCTHTNINTHKRHPLTMTSHLSACLRWRGSWFTQGGWQRALSFKGPSVSTYNKEQIKTKNRSVRLLIISESPNLPVTPSPSVFPTEDLKTPNNFLKFVGDYCQMQINTYCIWYALKQIKFEWMRTNSQYNPLRRTLKLVFLRSFMEPLLPHWGMSSQGISDLLLLQQLGFASRASNTGAWAAARCVLIQSHRAFN